MKRGVVFLSLGVLLAGGCSDREDDPFILEYEQSEAGVQAGPPPSPLDAGSLLDANLGQEPPPASDAALSDAALPDGDWGAKLRSTLAACRVNGVTYASGARAVPDPRSCNTCTCLDGVLTACTELACSNVCTSGSAFGFACVRFGVEGCLETEFGCRPACTSDEACAAPATCDLEQGVCWYRSLAP